MQYYQTCINHMGIFLDDLRNHWNISVKSHEPFPKLPEISNVLKIVVWLTWKVFPKVFLRDAGFNIMMCLVDFETMNMSILSLGGVIFEENIYSTLKHDWIALELLWQSAKCKKSYTNTFKSIHIPDKMNTRGIKTFALQPAPTTFSQIMQGVCELLSTTV